MFLFPRSLQKLIVAMATALVDTAFERVGPEGISSRSYECCEDCEGCAALQAPPECQGVALLLAQQATKAIDYATLGQGFPPQHPTDRLSYREGTHSSFVKSQSRCQRSMEALQELCRSSPFLSERALCQLFVKEIGCHPDLAETATLEGVRLALEHELLMPLRALNEGKKWMYQTFAKQPLPSAQIDEVVQDITASVLNNSFRAWRYGNPVGLKQLEGLSPQQLQQWQESSSTWVKLENRTIRVHEEDGLDLFWATKIGGPSHGFDVEGQCHLPLLANARSKVILVSDPSYPHHPVGRAHFKLLWTETNEPVLWLEKVNKDFRADVDTGLWLPSVLMLAVSKATAMNVRLSCDPAIANLLLSVGKNFQGSQVVKVQERLVLRPSNGVVEASDYLTDKHDWLQTEEELTPSLHRAVYFPPGLAAVELSEAKL